jgi:hypothetical protein
MNLARLSPGLWAALAIYVVLMATLVGGMQYVRGRVIADLSTPQARADWEAWRKKVAEKQDDPVVQRRIPKSDEPPHLVLMRDYFFGMLGSLALVVTFLYGFLVLVVRGAWRRTPASTS